MDTGKGVWQEAAVSDAGNSLLLTWEQELLAILKFRDGCGSL